MFKSNVLHRTFLCDSPGSQYLQASFSIELNRLSQNCIYKNLKSPNRTGEGFSGKIPASFGRSQTLHRRLVFLLFPLILLISCGRAGTVVPPTAVATPIPTASVTPTSMPLVILLVPADMPQAESDRYQTLVYDLARTNGMRFQVRNALTPADLAFEGSSLKVVIVLPPGPDLAALTAAAPGVQFLAVGIPDLAPATNLSSIGASGVPVDQQAFLAGYIAGLVAPEWKVGVLYQKDTPGGEAAKVAFTNGFYFYCGSCRNPLFPQPAGIYPVTVGIPTDAPLSAYNGHADILYQNIVKVAYVYPEIATPDLLSYMAQRDMLLISQTMPGQDIRPNWIASIQPDLTSALQSIFPDLVAGKGGKVAPTPLFITDVNPDLLSEAKLRLAQEILDGLQNGTIGTGVNP
jgi:hypothetical protein